MERMRMGVCSGSLLANPDYDSLTKAGAKAEKEANIPPVRPKRIKPRYKPFGERWEEADAPRREERRRQRAIELEEQKDGIKDPDPFFTGFPVDEYGNVIFDDEDEYDYDD